MSPERAELKKDQAAEERELVQLRKHRNFDQNNGT